MLSIFIFCDVNPRRCVQQITFWDNIKPQMIPEPLLNLLVYLKLHDTISDKYKQTSERTDSQIEHFLCNTKWSEQCKIVPDQKVRFHILQTDHGQIVSLLANVRGQQVLTFPNYSCHLHVKPRNEDMFLDTTIICHVIKYKLHYQGT